MTTLPVLIIGAGPFGLSLAAYLRRYRIGCLTIGKPALFWKACSPGALLAIASDWHLDALGVDTVDAYRQARKATSNRAEATACDSFPHYVRWFRRRKQLEILPWIVERVTPQNETFVAAIRNGEQIAASNVVVATCSHACGLAGCSASEPYSALLGDDILARMSFRDGIMQLDGSFRTSLPGLFLANSTTDHDFRQPSALFAQARASAASIGRGIRQRMQTLYGYSRSTK
ncbi:MAG: hypothetical protein R2844_04665 [Caldilineales bacterium]